MSQETVQQTVWPWRAVPAGKPAAKKPNRGMAVAQAVALLAVAALLYWRFHRPVPAAGLTVAALVMLVAAFLIPPLHAAIQRAAAAVTRWVSNGLTWVLLTPFFYLCFMPGNWILRLLRKDPLCRQFPTPAPTYWRPRPPVKDLAQYRKPY